MNDFRIDPILFFQGDEFERAQKSLEKYQSPKYKYTGRCFDRLVQQSNPNKITAADIVAVEMLSVDVPSEAAIWMLYEGAAEITGLLEQIPSEQNLWDDDADVGPDSPAQQLWTLVLAQHEVGRVKASKLLAAKRPRLIPIWDKHTAWALFGVARANWHSVNDWKRWRKRLRGPEGDELRLLAHSADGQTNPQPSLLRAIDIVVWMRVHGDKTLAELAGPGDRPPGDEPPDKGTSPERVMP